ncbi:MAG: DUF1080 domain-containing protein [Sedimentisphaerales bacterium]|nr:DUF1080 domain-containing protein [Sedimentisphaerales bacterium]
MKTSGVLFILMSAAVLLTSCSVLNPQGKRTALFDGKTLDGWTLIKCQAEVNEGDILLVSGNGLVQTEKKYGNFILEFDWKALRAERWDSGVYFRYDSVPSNRPWPDRYQVNLRYDMAGYLDNLRKVEDKSLIKAGDWNRFKLTVCSTTASLEINGKPAWEFDGLEGPEKGYIALQAEVPGGGQYRFRNIHLTEPD